MGGKVWSLSEEQYFWRTVVGQSLKRVGADLARPRKSWDELAANMQIAMDHNARREYTGPMLFEHWFQNIVTGRVSPNAIKHVRKYLEKGGQAHRHDSHKSLGTQEGTNTAREEGKSNLEKLRTGQDEEAEGSEVTSNQSSGKVGDFSASYSFPAKPSAKYLAGAGKRIEKKGGSLYATA